MVVAVRMGRSYDDVSASGEVVGDAAAAPQGYELVEQPRSAATESASPFKRSLERLHSFDDDDSELDSVEGGEDPRR